MNYILLNRKDDYMKKIVPFNNVLTFNTDVSEITAISLEHDITKEPDTVSGVFYITGEYKITDGVINTDKFSFELPFDIALGSEYDLSTLEVDIDDFRYELVDRDKLKVNIDLYLDGEELEHPTEIHEEVLPIDEELFTEREIRALNEEDAETPSGENEEENVLSAQEEGSQTEENSSEDEIAPARDNLLDEMLKTDEEENMKETEVVNENENENNNINIFNGFNEEEKYVTYRVYPVLEDDTLDRILEKYSVTKEELAKYNNLEDIKAGDKLIIPANDK